MADDRFETDRKRRRLRVSSKKSAECTNCDPSSLSTTYYGLLRWHQKHFPRSDSRHSPKPHMAARDALETGKHAADREYRRCLIVKTPSPPCSRPFHAPYSRLPVPELLPRKLVPRLQNFYQHSVRLKSSGVRPMDRHSLSVSKCRVKVDVDLRKLDPQPRTAKPVSDDSGEES